MGSGANDICFPMDFSYSSQNITSSCPVTVFFVSQLPTESKSLDVLWPASCCPLKTYSPILPNQGGTKKSIDFPTQFLLLCNFPPFFPSKIQTNGYKTHRGRAWLNSVIIEALLPKEASLI